MDIRDAPEGQYLHFHCNPDTIDTNNIGDLPVYSNTIWYNLKGIANILSLGLVKNHHLVTYKSRYGNEFVIHRPQQPTLNITKASIFYHDMRTLLSNKNNSHVIVNDSHSFITQGKEKNKQYTAHDVKISDRERRFHHTNLQPVKQTPCEIDNNILQNFPTVQEDAGMSEEIYGPSVPYLKDKTSHQKFQHVYTVVLLKVPEVIIDRYNNISLCCNLMHTNCIGFLNTIF